ncbi:DUF4145 domain-containing protein [Streptomyces erythrochromogenes]|uniref:DUF4145 domain-containing protein n=1 Tax=Streptomyces erythrochromogenes TaxID=285574 RepID=UPI003800D96A
MARMSTECGWCGRHAHMKPVSKAAELDRVVSRYGSVRLGVHQACACDYCGGINVAAGTAAERDLDSRTLIDSEINRWFPKAMQTKAYEHVPEMIASAANEAHGCLSDGYLRGAVMVARSVVESTAKAKGIDSGNLDKKIERMFQEGLIREHVRDAAHEVRFSGNEAAHGDLIASPIPVEDVEEILGLMDEILDEVFQSPARVAERRQKRQQREAAQSPAASKSGQSAAPR